MLKPHDAAVYDSTTEVDTAPEHGDHGRQLGPPANPVLKLQSPPHYRPRPMVQPPPR